MSETSEETLEQRLEDAIADAEAETANWLDPIFKPAFHDLDLLLAEYRFTAFREYFRCFEALDDQEFELAVRLWAHLVKVCEGETGDAVEVRTAEPVTLAELKMAIPADAEDDRGNPFPDDPANLIRVDHCADRLRDQFELLQEQYEELRAAAEHGRVDSVSYLTAQMRKTVAAMRRTRALWMRHLAYCWPPGLDRYPEDVEAAYATSNAFTDFMDAV